MKDVIVIGCGIMGATIAKTLVQQGRDVLVIDNRKSDSGTRPSGGHLKPSWFGMNKEDYEPALCLLDSTWGLIQKQFLIETKEKRETIYRVDTDQVINYFRVLTREDRASMGRVVEIVNTPLFSTVKWVTISGESKEENCKLVVVAAGVWTSELIEGLTIKGKQGISFRFEGTLPNGGFIQQWAPYKQIVAHQQKDGEIWVGDGSAILTENWTESHSQESLRRCRKALSLGVLVTPRKVLSGVRPYAETGKDPCLLKKVSPRVWVATGAGKRGTIAAGWSAKRIIDVTS